MQVVLRQGVALEDAQIEHVLPTDTGPDCYRRQKANLSCHGVEEDRNLSSWMKMSTQSVDGNVQALDITYPGLAPHVEDMQKGS